MEIHPPKYFIKFLRWFCREDYLEEIEGDLVEVFENQFARSPQKAKLHFAWSVLKYFRPAFIKSFHNSNKIYPGMFRHNLLFTYRSFLRYKSTFLINLSGLSAGLACTFLIYLWVNDEMNVDTFLQNGDRLFRVMEHRTKADGVWTSPTTSGPTADALTEDMPEVELACPTSWSSPYTLSIADKNYEALGRYAGKDFFKLFSYPIIQGNSSQLLSDKNSIVISDNLAKRLFQGIDQAIGKTVEFEHERPLQVSGVFQSMPSNASDQFEFVMSFDRYREQNDWLQNWGSTSLLTYVMLKPDVQVEDFNSRITDFIKKKSNNEITHRTMFLKGYAENYLYGKYENGVLTGGRITYVRLFSIIAIFVLIIACVNFINLSTAKATRRLKEVGIKKAIGAGRGTLVVQYLSESIVLSFLAFGLALGLVYMFLPQFNQIVEKHLVFHYRDISKILLMGGITLATGIIAGSYPALFLSGFSPINVLKGKLSGSGGELMVRKGLVVFQFSLSVIFISSVIVVYKQIGFVQSKDLGYKKDNLLYFGMPGALRDLQKQESLIAEINNVSGVESASSIGHNLTGHNSGTWRIQWEGKNPEDRTEFERVTVNYGMIETLGITMAEGRSFSRSFPADTARIIFNQKAIEFMGLKDPVGKTVNLWGGTYEIVGVAKDFNYESLHENFKPLFFMLAPDNTYLLMARIMHGKEEEAIQSIEVLYHKFNPGFSFDYKFLEDNYRRQYGSEHRVATLSKYFAGLAILISCLGLYGLASFTVERRTREISIRKILGSGELAIVYLLSGDFGKIVLAAIAIALPMSYFLSQSWLSSFAFKINLTWWYFIAAGCAAMIIAMLTVGLQTFRAARVNPTQSLKEE